MFKSCVYLQIFKETAIFHISIKALAIQHLFYFFSEQEYTFKVATNINSE